MSTKEPAHTVTHAVEIFYSYAHADKLLRDELEKHLSVLRRQGLISNWYDRLIEPGADWRFEIDNHLATAHIILLLVSSDFLASDYCYGIEMHKAMERHRMGETRVVPIILRPIYWQDASFGHLQALPTNGRPVTQWQDTDLAFVDVVAGLREIINNVKLVPQNPVPQVLKALNTVGEVASSSQDRWENAGPLGYLIRSFVASEQWEQAESAARTIEEHGVRSEVLCKLAIELAENEQWQRAEAIAYTIEKKSDKEVALVTIANKLIEAKQWQRAESIASSIKNRNIYSAMVQALIINGEHQRGSALAYSMQSIEPDTYDTASPTSLDTHGSHRLQAIPGIHRRSIALFPFILVILVLIGLVTAFLPPLRQWFTVLLATPSILIWGIISLLFIIAVIIAILRWLQK